MQQIKRRLSRGSKRDLEVEEPRNNLTGNSYEIPHDDVITTKSGPIAGKTFVIEDSPVVTGTAPLAGKMYVIPEEPVVVAEEHSNVRVFSPAVEARVARAFAPVQPVDLQQIVKTPVLREHVYPLEKEEIQPIIYREREQIEIHQVTQQLKEVIVNPTIITQVQTEAQYRDTVFVEDTTPRDVGAVSSREVRAPTTVVEELQPIVKEHVVVKVQEDVTHVLARDIIQPTIIEVTQPILDRVREVGLGTESETFEELPPIFGEQRELVLGNRSIITGRLPTNTMWEQVLVLPGERLVRGTATVDSFMMGRYVDNIEVGRSTSVVTAVGAAKSSLVLNNQTSAYNMPPSIAAIAAASVLPQSEPVPAGRVTAGRNLYYHLPASTGTMYTPQTVMVAPNNPAPQLGYQPTFGVTATGTGFQSHGIAAPHGFQPTNVVYHTTR